VIDSRRRRAALAITTAALGVTFAAVTLAAPTGDPSRTGDRPAQGQPTPKRPAPASKPAFAQQSPDITAPTPTECLGYVQNTYLSDVVIKVQLRSGALQPLDPGWSWTGTAEDPVVGYYIEGGTFIDVEYRQIPEWLPLTTDHLYVATATSYAVDPCHAAIVTATR
jgi:hypothetical protein